MELDAVAEAAWDSRRPIQTAEKVCAIGVKSA